MAAQIESAPYHRAAAHALERRGRRRRWKHPIVRSRLLLPLAVLLLTGCGQLDTLETSPPVTPAEWCEQRPCVTVGDAVLNEPLGSVLVFGLALLWIGVGGYFLATRHGQRSRLWLGIALVLGGLGAAQAGISYQAFSYELKCAGREVCVLTNGFEVGYSLTQAWSVSAMVVAVAYATAQPRLRRAIIIYAMANGLVYTAVLAAGVLLPSALLLSFTMLMLFAVPGIIITMVLSWRGYRRTGEAAHRTIFVAALLLIAVNVAYYAYWAAGITQALWQDGEGFSFSENDVLHVGYIAWLLYVAFGLGPHLADEEQEPAPTAR